MEMNLPIKISTQVMLNELADENKNTVTSPMSTNIILNVLTIGTNGNTKKQLMDALEAKSDDEINCVSASLMMLLNGDGGNGDPIISMVNGLWSDLQFPFKASYRKHATDFYKAHVRSFNFQTKGTLEKVRRDVNAWAEKETKGLIKELIAKGTLDERARIVKANALYFKATWKKPFDQFLSRNDKFYLLNGETVEVPYMVSFQRQYYRSFDDFKLLRLPYKSFDEKAKQFSMHIYLPKKKDGLASLLKKFHSDPSFIRAKCDEFEVVDITYIPKFQFLYDFKPSDIMKEMGIDLPFDTNGRAELTNMVDSVRDRFLAVSTILQKSYVEVNEEGTEAASATEEYDGDVGFALSSEPPPPPVTFIADHPFLFSIKEDISGAVLFVGVVQNPLS